MLTFETPYSRSESILKTYGLFETNPLSVGQRPDQFVQTITEKLMTYGLGRRVEYYDMPAVRQIVRDAARDNYRFSSIVMGIVKSAPFQMRKSAE